MNRPDFVHLHLHTEYSLLDSTIRHGALMEQVVAHGSKAVGVTDHGNMFGAVSFYEAATAKGLKPILGCELYVAPASRFDPTSGGIREAAYHLTVLAADATGYSNLCRLVTAGYLDGFHCRPRVDLDLLEQHNEGLIVLSGCVAGEVPRRLAQRGRHAAMRAIERYRGIFGDRYYLEIQQNGAMGQERVNEELIEIARHTGIKLVATNDCHYLTREEAPLHSVVLCIQANATRDQACWLPFTGDAFHVRSPEEMAALFSGLPEALASTVEIADRCQLELAFKRPQLPRFETPEGKDLDEYLRELARAGLNRRLTRIARDSGGRTAELASRYRGRLEHELQVITRMGFSGYFLIVSDYVGYAKSVGIPVGPGRGATAGSLVAHCLDITDADPLRHDLLFERFINPERTRMPDIDVDFCMARRDKVIRYVTAKYGEENVAQITTFGAIAAEAAVRDAGRVLGLSFVETDQITRLFRPTLGLTIETALQEEPPLREMRDGDPRFSEVIDTARSLEGLIRHASTHPAGIVIGARPLIGDVPLYARPHDRPITQYPMTDLEKLGLIKFDFLGLKTLTVIAQVVDRVRGTRGIELDLSDLPLDDAPTFRLLSDADTEGVFQFEISGMKDLLRRVQPSSFEDLVALLALYRPGPLESGLVESYVARRNGVTSIEYDHPAIEEILRNTHGLILYQEQVMQIASRIASFSMAEADALLEAVRNGDGEEIWRLRTCFVSGSEHNGIEGSLARTILDDLKKFGAFSFNKAHATAYALIAYRTAYLKAHFRAEFMAASSACSAPK